jgi:hypothetical protein
MNVNAKRKTAQPTIRQTIKRLNNNNNIAMADWTTTSATANSSGEARTQVEVQMDETAKR